ncbi:hypothetical protein BGX28_007473 [Mortierella sp. GBA30]|nr:hypothetical protein BGX28_007473 [Mortierella sp. GBA30]
METLGVWSRRLMSNYSVDKGSMYSTVKQALDEGYGVVILNPNAHWWVDGRAEVLLPARKEYQMVPHLESPEEHVDYVLRNLVQYNAVNYIQSDVEDKGKVGHRETVGCNCVNAGTQEYDVVVIEMMPTVFQFFNERKGRDNAFEKYKDLILPPNEYDPTTTVITFDEVTEDETHSAVEDDSRWHDSTPVHV